MKQTVFSGTGIVPTTQTSKQRINQATTLQKIEKMKSIRASCPYCCYITTMEKFAKIDNDYKIEKNYKCPRCGAMMLEKTLFIMDKGPLSYSRWFWNTWYADKHYRKRFRMDLVKESVKEWSFDDVFWDVWREVKGKKDSSS